MALPAQVLARHGMVWPGPTWPVLALAWPGPRLAWPSMAWPGLLRAWFGLAWSLAEAGAKLVQVCLDGVLREVMPWGGNTMRAWVWGRREGMGPCDVRQGMATTRREGEQVRE